MATYIFKQRFIAHGLLLGLIVLVTSLVQDNLLQRQRIVTRDHVSKRVQSLSSQLEITLQRDLTIMMAVKAYIEENPDIQQEAFERICRILMGNRSNIMLLAAAPDLVVRLIHPHESNKKAIGLDYNKNEKQRQAALMARDVGKVVVAGPLTLVQGGRGLVARVPVWVDVRGEKKFWGLVAAPISLDELLEQAGFMDLEDDLKVAIRGKDAQGSKGEVFWGDATIFKREKIMRTVDLPHGSWQVAAIPSGGWYGNDYSSLWLTAFGFYLLLFLATERKLKVDVELKKSQVLLSEARDKAIEERNKAEENAKVKGAFVAMMSHEIRTPMNGVLGAAEVLKQADMKPDEKQCLELIIKHGSYMLKILNDILDIAKFEHGDVSLDEQPCRLSMVIEECRDIFSPIAKEKNIALNFDVDPQFRDRELWLDPVRLRQVMTNLIENAIKFSEEGEVQVEIRAEEDSYIVSVSDTGIGMAKDRLSEVFKPFVQAESDTTRRFGGTGLGLSITKNIVQSMKGQITVDSELGKGSTFTLSLPLRWS